MDKNITAFPSENIDGFGKKHAPNLGMTLRDYFAAKAMQSYMQWALNQQIEENDNKEKAASRYAKASYLIANAMMKERKNEK